MPYINTFRHRRNLEKIGKLPNGEDAYTVEYFDCPDKNSGGCDECLWTKVN